MPTESPEIAQQWDCESVWDPCSDPTIEWAHVPAPDMLLRYPDAVNVCAPMVRYSKHAFRSLVSLYNTQITTTPMILAAEFSRSSLARDADFSTSDLERGFFAFEKATARRRRLALPQHDKNPDAIRKDSREYVRGSLICQMAAHETKSLADAAELVAPYVDGIDLNCGWYVSGSVDSSS